MSIERRKATVEPHHPELSIVRQCRLLSIARASYYREPSGESAMNLALMRVIDAQFLETPWYGSRQMARHLRRQDWCVGRKRIRRLMRKMGLVPIYQRPRTSVPHPEHRVYPYLLRDLTVERPNQVWCADVTYIPMRRGFLYLVAIMDWASRKVLAWRALVEHDGCRVLRRRHRRGARSPWPAGDLQHRSGQPVHQPCLHCRAEGGRHPDLHGRSWPVDGQRLHRTAVALAQI